MDRPDFSSDAATPSGTGGGGAGGAGDRDFSTTPGYGNPGDVSGAQGYGAGSTADVGQAYPDSTTDDSHGFADRARGAASTAQDKLADVGSTVRERTGQMKNSLADALHTGADKLRHRSNAPAGSSSQLAGATDSGSVAVPADSRTAQMTDRVATGMDAAADWLHDADLESLKTGLERQVKEHPGRTLLIAAGVGYLLGKAFRRD
jgi:ElaB/YqjD/DUF883 family membrane-anchored ribosome-binding protein